jgi:hypothetical protein
LSTPVSLAASDALSAVPVRIVASLFFATFGHQCASHGRKG